ncbi:MAG TPA: serine/threonine-protein kinase [Miltoncostaea sp.]|nr:serine/threonine-protein kinase [Miltoncostaea sp.]
MTTLAPARLAGPWELGERIGGGSQATVHRARHAERGTVAAVKVIHPSLWSDPGFRIRFRRECEALGAVRHPAVVPIIDHGESEGRGYLAMALAREGTLADRLADGPPPVPEGLRLIAAVAAGLDAAHGVGLVHRDVTPSNILLDPDGPWLADFGIARRDDATLMTEDGLLIGTAGYLAPEVISGGRAGPAADRYALAAVAFRVLTGQRPFTADRPEALLYAHLHKPVPRASALRPGLPREVDAILARGMAKHPDDRPRSGAALAGALARALRPAEAGTVPLVRPRRRRRRPGRRALATGFVALTAAVGVAGLGLAVLGPDGTTHAPPPPAAPAPKPRPTVPGPSGEIVARDATAADLPGIGAVPGAAVARVDGATLAAFPGGWSDLAQVRAALEAQLYSGVTLADGERPVAVAMLYPTDLIGLGERWVLMVVTTPGKAQRALVIHGEGSTATDLAAAIARGLPKVVEPPS